MDNYWMEEQWDREKEEERERKRSAHRLRIREEMRRRKKRQRQIRRMLKLALPLAGMIGIIILVIGAGKIFSGKDRTAFPQNTIDKIDTNTMQQKLLQQEEALEQKESAQSETVRNIDGSGNQADTDKSEKGKAVYEAHAAEDTVYLDNIYSTNAVIIDLESGTILGQKDAKTIINPASMTKILTLLVAAENITDLEDSFTITQDILDYCFVNDCSAAGFEKDETVTVKDLLYGTVLPSGADAAIGLAVYTAGSQEAFVDMMNDKLEELGLYETAHFTNCVGIYDEKHYCTIYDMAMIIKAAMDNELCRKVLSTRTYVTSVTEQHPEGITIDNWFLRRIEDKDAGGEVLGGKTGYVAQSGSCAASFGEDKEGRELICVTGNANSQWRCLEDHAAIYKRFSGEDG